MKNVNLPEPSIEIVSSESGPQPREVFWSMPGRSEMGLYGFVYCVGISCWGPQKQLYSAREGHIGLNLPCLVKRNTHSFSLVNFNTLLTLSRKK